MKPLHIMHSRRAPLTHRYQSDPLGRHTMWVGLIIPAAFAVAWLATWVACEIYHSTN